MADSVTQSLNNSTRLLLRAMQDIDDSAAAVTVAGNPYCGGVLGAISANVAHAILLLTESVAVLIEQSPEDIIANAENFIAIRQAQILGEDE